MNINRKKEVILVAYSIFQMFPIRNPLRYNPQVTLSFLTSKNDIDVDMINITSDSVSGKLDIDLFGISILINKNMIAPRRYFTLAHELGHFYLHRDKKSQSPQTFRDTRKSIIEANIEMLNNTIDPFEQEANLFASEMLIPKSVLYSFLAQKYNFFRISKILNVSHECLKWRIVRQLKEKYNFDNDDCVLLVDNYKELSKSKYQKSASIFYLDNPNVDHQYIFNGIENNIDFPCPIEHMFKNYFYNSTLIIDKKVTYNSDDDDILPF
ncbi:MAG: ImmA/IrrE family metallo-endopeptidase [Neobacillus sp.]|nr:ImmA/IrrE family metallo-endopeptidase [Neobacillus sp.]